MRLPIGPSQRVWLRRVALAASAVIAGYHVISTGPIVHAYSVSTMELEPKQIALALWHFTSVVLISIPVALAWSFRVPTERARPVQIYTLVLVGGLLGPAAFLVALTTAGPSGLLTMPQWLVGLVLTALIAGSMDPRPEHSSRERSGELPGVTPQVSNSQA